MDKYGIGICRRVEEPFLDHGKWDLCPSGLCSIFTAHRRSCSKVMFSVVSVRYVVHLGCIRNPYTKVSSLLCIGSSSMLATPGGPKLETCSDLFT